MKYILFLVRKWCADPHAVCTGNVALLRKSLCVISLLTFNAVGKPWHKVLRQTSELPSSFFFFPQCLTGL